MTGPEHYRKAEQLLRVAKAEDFGTDNEQYSLAAALVHAALAQAAAFIYPFLVTGEDTAGSIEAWRRVTLP